MRALDLIRPHGGEPVSAAVNSVDTLARRTRDAVSTIAVLARSLIDPSRLTRLNGVSADPAGRFEAACALYDRTEADLVRIQDVSHRAFLLYVAAAASLLAIDVATWRSYAVHLLFVLGHVAPVVLALALAFRAAFGNWQVRRARLSSARHFLVVPGEWWPEPSSPARATVSTGAASLVLLLGLAAACGVVGTATPALADTGSGGGVTALFSALPASDLWGKLLTYVFPGVGPITGQTTPVASGIAAAFSALISILMGLAATFLAVQTLVAVIATAHEGTVLGRWHQVWAPLRVVYGFASLAPVVKGYCLLQLVALWLAVAGGQLGDTLWSSFVSTLSTPGSVTAPSLPETTAFVRDMLRTEVCAAEAAQVDSSYNIAASTWPSTYSAGSTVSTVASGTWSYITSWWSGTAANTSPITLQRIVWDYGPCGQVTTTSSPTASGPLGALSTAQLKAVDTLRASLKTAATSIVAATQSGAQGAASTSLSNIMSDVIKAKNVYDTSLSSAAATFASSAGNATFSSFQSSATAAGWLAAGPYYMTIARMNSSIADAASSLPTVDDTSYAANRISGPLLDALYGKDAPSTIDPLAVLPTLDATWDATISSPSAGGLSVAAASAGTLRTGGAWGALKGALSTSSYLQKTALSAVMLDPGSFDGLQEMVNTGDYIVGVSEAVIGVDLLAQVAPYLAGPEGAVAKLASGTKSLGLSDLFRGGIGTLLLLAGLYDSVVLPMLPCIFMIFAAVGILVTVVEAVVAAPLWALAHVDMSGSEPLGQRQRVGYGLALNLFLRIPLTVMGVLFSFLVFDAAVWLLSVVLYPAMASATAESLSGVLTTVTLMVLISALSYAAANRSFALINAVPDRVLRWLGGTDGASDETNTAHSAVAVVRQGGGGLSMRGGRPGGGAGVRTTGANRRPDAPVRDEEPGSIAPAVEPVQSTEAAGAAT